jgi:hypothetical protein
MAKMPEIVTLKEACEILKISLGYGYQIYHTWPEYGVRILKTRPNARPRFYVEDLLKMLEKPK